MATASSDDQPHPPRASGVVTRLVVALAVLLFAAMIMAMIMAVFRAGSRIRPSGCFWGGSMTLSGVEALTNMQFPPNAEMVGSADLTFFRPHIMAHIRMSTADFATFRQASPVVFSAKPADGRQVIGHLTWHDADRWPWWRLDGLPETFLCAYHVEPTEDELSMVERHVAVLVDLDAKDSVELYLDCLVD